MVPPSTSGHVSVVTVLYNSSAVIEKCMRAIPADAEVIVVDNASSDDSGARAIRARADAIVVRARRNLGFGGGCDLGWKHATRPYVAFVNPDVVLGANSLAVLSSRLDREPHGIVGPVLVDDAGELRPPNREPSAMTDFVNLLPWTGRWAHLRGRDGRLPADHPSRRDGGPVPFVEGACFMVRRADLEAIGGFDPDVFLYCEEQLLTMRLRSLGGRAVYETRTVVRHSGAHSTERVSRSALRHYYRSRVILYRKRDGARRGRLIAASLLAGAVMQFASAAVNALLRRPRAVTPMLAFEAFRGIVSGVRAELHQDPV